MVKKMKCLLRKICPLPWKTFLVIIDELAAQIQRNTEQILSQQHRQDDILEKLITDNKFFKEELRCTNQKIIELQQNNQKISELYQKNLRENSLRFSKLLCTYILNTNISDTYSENRTVKRLSEIDESLSFLKYLYLQHDYFTKSDTMELFKQEYVNSTLSVCLEHLHSEQCIRRKQLIYDALKNQVIDDLELSGYDESFYYDQDCYQELCDIVNRAYDCDYFPVLSKAFYDKALAKWFHQKTGLTLNLENPVTYNDKINWIKLYEHDPRKTQYADKYAVREYVANTIGSQYLIPLIGVWDDPEKIDFDLLPDQFVLKANHGAAWNIIVPDKSVLNIPEAIERMKWWLGKKFSYHACLELHYDGIPPRIIAEQYQENTNGELNDYKVWCFDGKAHFIQYLTSRHHGLKMAFYDLDWNKLPFITNNEQITETLEKPNNLEELIILSEKLATGFNHVRVDFYRLNSGEWKFGEMTFTPAGGKCLWNPPEYNMIIGNLLNINKRDK